MKHSLLAILLMVIIPISLLSNSLELLQYSNSSMTIKFNSKDLDKYLSNTSQRLFDTQANELVLTNNYNLPILNTLIQIPNNHKAIVSVLNPVYDNFKHKTLTKIDNDISVSDQHIQLSEPFIMRNNLLASLSVQPFLYNQSDSSINALIEADLLISFIPDSNSRLDSSLRLTPEYKSWLSKSVINFQDNTRLGNANGSILIIYNQTASPLSTIQPLIDWKHQMGWVVNAVSTTTTGSTTALIKNYIQNAYNTWVNPPEYIFIIGRATSTNTVPTYTEYYNYSTVGDYRYTLLEGNDLIPDAYIGRLTFASTDQLTSIINKIIAYEKKQGLANTNWYDSSLLLSDETDSGPSCTTNIDYVRDLMLLYNANTQISYVNSPSFASQAYSALNQGVSQFYYRGHNGYSGMTNTDINNLINTGKYPFISMITCFSGNFGSQSQLCIGEQFMRIGTSTIPKGAIGFIGASCETHTCLNNIMTGSIAYGFYREGLSNQGQALQRAKLGLYACYPQNPHDYIQQNFQALNLLGDPSLNIWLKQPTDIVVTYPQTAFSSNGSMRISVNDSNGNPIMGAKACILKGNDELFLVGYTNSQGLYEFSWSNATNGTASITISKANHATYRGTFEVLSTPNPVSIVNTTSFGQLMSGMDYNFPITVANNQHDAIINVTGTLSSISEFVVVESGGLTFGNIAFEQSITSQQHVRFKISKLCPQNEPIHFTLIINGYVNNDCVTFSKHFAVNESGPSLDIADFQLGTENILLPGSTTNLFVKLKNKGNVTATGISAFIYSFNPYISLSQTNQPFNNLFSQYSTTNTTPFVIEASPLLQSGTPVLIWVEVSYNNGASQLLQLPITVGAISQTSMTGPDQYGYICIANNDIHPLASPYNWVELNPNLGGDGIVLNMTDSDMEGSGSYQTIDLPFVFRYYGVQYTQITVCSNGFIMPGSQGSQEWMNWQIPGPMVPRPIIAPFWDDLIINSDSRIVYKDDSVNGRFIVEWSKLRNKYNLNAQETFQVIIYNQATNSTPTGDNSFLFQYNTFNNVDAGNYGVAYVDHGQYATVGIADHTGTMGLQYTYQNLYPATASILTNSSTLFFSTMLNQNHAPNPIIQSYQFVESTVIFDNGQIDSGETIDLLPMIFNTGSTSLSTSECTLSSDDPYITMINANSMINTINPYQSQATNTPFVFVVSPDCPNGHTATLNLNIASNLTNHNLVINIVIQAPQIEFSTLQANNMLLSNITPHVLTHATLLIQNRSNLNLINAEFSFADIANLQITPNHIQCNIPAGNSVNLSFDILALDDLILGSVIALSGTFSVPNIYDSTFAQIIYIGGFDNLYNQGFENPISLPQWSFSEGIEINQASLINPIGYEVLLSPQTGINEYTITTPDIYAHDSQLIMLGFKYVNIITGTSNRVLINYNNSDTWFNVYDFSSVTQQIQNVCFLIEPQQTPIYSIKLKWIIDINNNREGLLALDDIYIKAIHHAKGFIHGTIVLDNHPELITQVRISTFEYPDTFVNPNQDGSYVLPLFQGYYSHLIADLSNFIPNVINNITVNSNQITALDTTTLNYLRKPIELTYQIEENTLYLNWNLESLQAGNRNRLNPTYYKIYITHDLITTIDSSATNHFQKNIVHGIYDIYVKSIYLSQTNSEYDSENSDPITINHTSTNNPDVTSLVFGLNQNYPNPFNPKTIISYTINKPNHTTLRIYNAKGELVKQLINENLLAGQYMVEFDGKNNYNRPLPSGLYFYRLSSGSNVITRKMILMK